MFVCVVAQQEEFRVDQGKRLLKIMDRVFARRMNSHEGSFVLYLSKPTHREHQLLMNVVAKHGLHANTPTHTYMHSICVSIQGL